MTTLRLKKYVVPLVKVKVKSLFATPWTVAHQAPLSMGFSRPGYWSGLPFPSPGDLPNPGIEPGSPALQADAGPSEPPTLPLMKGGSIYGDQLKGSTKALCRWT